MFVIFEQGFDVLKDHSDFEELWDTINEISELKTKEHVSLTNKTVFKLMDIVDEYEDEI